MQVQGDLGSSLNKMVTDLHYWPKVGSFMAYMGAKGEKNDNRTAV